MSLRFVSFIHIFMGSLMELCSPATPQRRSGMASRNCLRCVTEMNWHPVQEESPHIHCVPKLVNPSFLQRLNTNGSWKWMTLDPTPGTREGNSLHGDLINHLPAEREHSEKPTQKKMGIHSNPQHQRCKATVLMHWDTVPCFSNQLLHIGKWLCGRNV